MTHSGIPVIPMGLPVSGVYMGFFRLDSFLQTPCGAVVKNLFTVLQHCKISLSLCSPAHSTWNKAFKTTLNTVQTDWS